MRFIRRLFASLLVASSAVGLLGYPADAPTWYRCISGLKPCPDSLVNLPVIDAAKVWNLTILIVGVLLLIPPPWTRSKRRRLEPATTEFYAAVRTRLLELQHQGLVLNQRIRSLSAEDARNEYQSVVNWGTWVSRVLVLYLPGSNRYFTERPTGTAEEHMDFYLARLNDILEDVNMEIERPAIEARQRLAATIKELQERQRSDS